jgi:hypothetical protein
VGTSGWLASRDPAAIAMSRRRPALTSGAVEPIVPSAQEVSPEATEV